MPYSRKLFVALVSLAPLIANVGVAQPTLVEVGRYLPDDPFSVADILTPETRVYGSFNGDNLDDYIVLEDRRESFSPTNLGAQSIAIYDGQTRQLIGRIRRRVAPDTMFSIGDMDGDCRPDIAYSGKCTDSAGWGGPGTSNCLYVAGLFNGQEQQRYDLGQISVPSVVNGQVYVGANIPRFSFIGRPLNGGNDVLVFVGASGIRINGVTVQGGSLVQLFSVQDAGYGNLLVDGIFPTGRFVSASALSFGVVRAPGLDELSEPYAGSLQIRSAISGQVLGAVGIDAPYANGGLRRDTFISDIKPVPTGTSTPDDLLIRLTRKEADRHDPTRVWSVRDSVYRSDFGSLSHGASAWRWYRELDQVGREVGSYITSNLGLTSNNSVLGYLRDRGTLALLPGNRVALNQPLVGSGGDIKILDLATGATVQNVSSDTVGLRSGGRLGFISNLPKNCPANYSSLPAAGYLVDHRVNVVYTSASSESVADQGSTAVADKLVFLDAINLSVVDSKHRDERIVGFGSTIATARGTAAQLDPSYVDFIVGSDNIGSIGGGVSSLFRTNPNYNYQTVSVPTQRSQSGDALRSLGIGASSVTGSFVLSRRAGSNLSYGRCLATGFSRPTAESAVGLVCKSIGSSRSYLMQIDPPFGVTGFGKAVQDGFFSGPSGNAVLAIGSDWNMVRLYQINSSDVWQPVGTFSAPSFVTGNSRIVMHSNERISDTALVIGYPDSANGVGGIAFSAQPISGVGIWSRAGDSPGSEFGAAISSIKSLVMPPLVAVGAPGTNGGRGEVQLFDPLGNLVRRVAGTVPGGRFGAALSFIADRNGDQTDELLVGAPGVRGGVVEIIDPVSGNRIGQLVSPVAEAQFGSALATYQDGLRVLVGAPNAGQARTGAVYEYSTSGIVAGRFGFVGYGSGSNINNIIVRSTLPPYGVSVRVENFAPGAEVMLVVSPYASVTRSFGQGISLPTLLGPLGRLFADPAQLTTHSLGIVPISGVLEVSVPLPVGRAPSIIQAVAFGSGQNGAIEVSKAVVVSH